MAKSRQDLIKKRDALIRQKNKHYDKIQEAESTGINTMYIDHWLTEIENFELQIQEVNAKLCNHKH